MAQKIYAGINSTAQNIEKIYVGVDGIARKVIAGYVGINGVAVKFYNGQAPSAEIILDNWTIGPGTTDIIETGV